MADLTYFVALPFDRNADGELVAGEPREAQSQSAAVRLAAALPRQRPAPWLSPARAIRRPANLPMP
jgi:hypothetical protein